MNVFCHNKHYTNRLDYKGDCNEQRNLNQREIKYCLPNFN